MIIAMLFVLLLIAAFAVVLVVRRQRRIARLRQIQVVVDDTLERIRADVGIVGEHHGVVYMDGDQYIMAFVTDYEQYEIDRALYGDDFAAEHYTVTFSEN